MSNKKFNINTASIEDIKTIRGIGKVAIEKIEEARQIGTTINSVEELKAIAGIQDRYIEDISGQLTFDLPIQSPVLRPEKEILQVRPSLKFRKTTFQFSIKLDEALQSYRTKLIINYAYRSNKNSYIPLLGKYELSLLRTNNRVKLAPKNGYFLTDNLSVNLVLVSAKGTKSNLGQYLVGEGGTIDLSKSTIEEKIPDTSASLKIKLENKQHNLSYTDYRLKVTTVAKKGDDTLKTDTQEYELLPDFEIDIELDEIKNIESAGIVLLTPLGEKIDTQEKNNKIKSWKDIKQGGDLWKSDTITLQLPTPKKIDSKVILEEEVETSLDKWADHTLLVYYDIFDEDDGNFQARVEEEYPIKTATQGSHKDKGTAKVDFIYYGTVNEVNFQVKSPRGEIIGKGIKTPEAIKAKGGEIEIKVPPRRKADILNLKKYPNRSKKTVGRVIDFHGNQKFEGIQVIIYATNDANVDITNSPDGFTPILTASTETDGYFVINTPKEPYKKAYAIVSVEGQDDAKKKLPIILEEDNIFEYVEQNSKIVLTPSKGLFFPSKLILVVDGKTEEKEENCGCGDGDVLDFHHPRKVLEEFSYYSVVRTTEPQIKGYTIAQEGKIAVGAFIDLVTDIESSDHQFSEYLQFELDKDIVLKYINNRNGLTVNLLEKAIKESKSRKLTELIKPKQEIRARGRRILDAGSSIDWDEDPTIYQATSIAHGHMLHFKQEWVNDGYSLGDLLCSLPLAPGQKKQIVTYDWERKEAAKGREFLDYQDQLANNLARDRDVNEIVSGTVNESMRGGSRATTSSKSRGGGIGAAAGGMLKGVLFGVGGGFAASSGRGSSSSSAWQNSAKNSSMQNMQRLRDTTTQVASSVRSQRSTVIQTLSQEETSSVTTESVANYNHCHAITIQYFEVLRHFRLEHRLSDVQECLFIPLQMTTFDTKKALRWREELSQNMLDDPFSRKIELRKLMRGRQNPLLRGFDAIERIENNYENSNLPNGKFGDAAINYFSGTLYLKFQLFRPEEVKDEDGNTTGHFWGSFLEKIIGARIIDKFEQAEATLKDQIFQREVAPEIALKFVKSLKVRAIIEDSEDVALPIDLTLVSSYRDNRDLEVSLRMENIGDFEGIPRSAIKGIRIWAEYDNEGIEPSELLSPKSRVIISRGYMGYRTDYYSSYLFRSNRIKNDLTGSGTDGVEIYTANLNALEMRNPSDEDKELAHSLLDHLNDNLEYYHNVIWTNMNPRRRYMFLDGIQVVDYSEIEQYPEGVIRSVASVVENELLGIEGNCLIMPVSPGFRLDPNIKGQDIDLLELYQPPTPIEPVRVSVPTKGVFAESVMGKCNSCERKEEDRFWRWEESPIPDSPTAIQPVSTDSRRATPLDTTPTPLQNPMISIQNAPAAPNPSGFGALAQLLSHPNFENITGLNANQRNALEGLLASYDTTTAFGNMATSLAAQALSMAPGAAKLNNEMKAIRNAKANNQITDAKAQEFSEKALENSITQTGQNNSIKGQEDNIAAINKLVADGHLSREDGNRYIKKTMEKAVGEKALLINNPAVEEQIKQGGKINYEGNGEKLSVENNGIEFASSMKATLPANILEWKSLFNFQVNEETTQALRKRKMYVQTLNSVQEHHVTIPKLNIDYYPVIITQLPTKEDGNQYTPSELLEVFRYNINDYLNEIKNHPYHADDDLQLAYTEFLPYDEALDISIWKSENPVSTVFKIDLAWYTFENATIVCSSFEKTKFRFSTIHSPLYGYHPVSGHREFGYFYNSSNELVFYTRGIDRLTTRMDDNMNDLTFGGIIRAQDKLWTSFQSGLKANIEEIGQGDGQVQILKRHLHHLPYFEAKNMLQSIII